MDIDTKQAEEALNALMKGIRGEYNKLLIDIAKAVGIEPVLVEVYSERFPVEELVGRIKTQAAALENEKREMAAEYNATLNTISDALGLNHVILGPYYNKDSVLTAATEIRKEAVHLKSAIAAKEAVIKDSVEHESAERAVSHEACTFMAGLMQLLGKGHEVTPHAFTCMQDRELEPDQVKAIGTELFEEVMRLYNVGRTVANAPIQRDAIFAPVRWEDLQRVLGWWTWIDQGLGDSHSRMCERKAGVMDIQLLLESLSARIKSERIASNRGIELPPIKDLHDAIAYLHGADRAAIRTAVAGEVVGYYMLVRDGARMTMVDIASFQTAKRVG